MGVMGLTHHKFNANRIHAMWTIKGWRVTNENVNICMQILCIQLRIPMTLQFDNVGPRHGLNYAFQHVTMADPDRGLFGATPVETLHAFRKGLVEMVTHVVIDNVPPSRKAALDRLALHFHKAHRQSFRSSFPSTTFCNGITNISMISAAERLGLVFLFVILGHYEEGWTILSSALDNCHKKREETVSAQKVIGMNLPSEIFCKCLKPCSVLTSG